MLCALCCDELVLIFQIFSHAFLFLVSTVVEWMDYVAGGDNSADALTRRQNDGMASECLCARCFCACVHVRDCAGRDACERSVHV